MHTEISRQIHGGNYKYLNRKEQSEYLKERGLRIGDSRLRNLAWEGKGPKEKYFGRRPYSTPDWLDRWIETRLTDKPTFSTRSDRDEEDADDDDSDPDPETQKTKKPIPKNAAKRPRREAAHSENRRF